MMRQQMGRRTLAMMMLVVGISAGGISACGTIPKPRALSAFEQLKKASQAQGALAGLEKQDRILLEQSQQAEERAVEAWQDGDAPRAEQHAALARALFRQALARAELARTRASLRRGEHRVQGLSAQDEQVQRHLARVEELIALHEELAMARINTREKALHLSEVQRLAGAQRLVNEARLALKVAETVEAQRLAKQLYGGAAKLVERAIALLAQKKSGKAAAMAQAAQREAQAAYGQAKPRFLKNKLAAQRAQNIALQREAALWAKKHRGVTVRVGAAPSGPQLELRLTSLFAPGKSDPHAKKLPALDALGALLSRYPRYPVLIRGFTSHRTPKEQRASVSKARAHAVRQRLLRAGLTAERFVAEGAAASKLIGHRNSAANDRVELIVPLAADSIDDKQTTTPTFTQVRDVGDPPAGKKPSNKKAGQR